MRNITNGWNDIIKPTFFVILLGFACMKSYAQTTPTDSVPGDPGAISVFTVQNMSFGAFTHGNAGGTVTISNDGSRSVTGDVVALNLGVAFFQAIFDIDAPQGSIISILNGPDVVLTGSTGGSMLMRIGPSNPGSPFNIVVSQPQRTTVNIGGTLTVGNSSGSPPGNYTGNFYITFNQE